MSSQDYVNGKMHGSFINYDKNGLVFITGNYENGEKNGEWFLDKERIMEVFEMGVLKSKELVKKS